MSERVSYPDAAYDCGDRLLYRHDWQQKWGIGIVTDLFKAPISGKFVYVIDGEGFYEHELTADIDDVPPGAEMYACPGCGKYVFDAPDGRVRDYNPGQALHTCDVPEPQSLKVAP